MFVNFRMYSEYLPGMDVPVTAGEVDEPPMPAVTESWFTDDAIGDNERHNPGEVHHIINESGSMAQPRYDCKFL